MASVSKLASLVVLLAWTGCCLAEDLHTVPRHLQAVLRAPGPAPGPAPTMAPTLAPAAAEPPPPPPLTGRTVMLLLRLNQPNALSSAGETILKAAIAQVLAPLGVVSDLVYLFPPTQVQYRRKLQATGQQYNCYIQVPGTTTMVLLQAEIEAAAQNGALNVAIAQLGGTFSMAYLSSTNSAIGTQSPPPPACSSQFSGHCLDGKHINRGGVIAVIIIGSLLAGVTLLAAACWVGGRYKKQAYHELAAVQSTPKVATYHERR